MPEIPFVDTSEAIPLTILLSLAPPDGTTRYVDQVTAAAPPQVSFRFFSWREALFGRYDAFHVHWPEFLIRDGHPARRMARLALFRLLLARLRLRGAALVRTLHNLHPHEPGDAFEQRSLERCDRHTDLFIRLNAATPLEGKTGVTILHGHYRGRYRGVEGLAFEPGRILYFGLIKPYKGVERLLEVFRGMSDADLRLRVVGKPSGSLRELVEGQCRDDPRITARLEFVPDDVLAQEVCGAELVVLPYREMHNSGAILVALSLDRPVLVPRSPSNAMLAAEVGPGWINMFEGELTSDILRDCLARVRDTPRAARPRLEGRDWSVVGDLHYKAYRTAIALRRQEAACPA
ncbi:glycosyltransferase [Novosphingobium album (ex Liu et al. 2023)]|uniref:Glycosyltransferase n=1 Tax=Novosphingobium album (ex Liu et al. 2023) TaxID=3031130 RepID=A0ABT5WK96_9SPHN|nr:glycosyltransferase [Novosphingobium album (ex Liu et al. 2023)]MDE8650468.1 hypothetical protein [Novosphingobium album (ex Liu et al. 2023)]